jgi:hypothetical protein
MMYPEIEDDRKVALRLILKLWGWGGVNEWNKTLNNRIAEKLRGTAADTLPNFVFLDEPEDNGRKGSIVVENHAELKAENAELKATIARMATENTRLQAIIDYDPDEIEDDEDLHYMSDWCENCQNYYEAKEGPCSCEAD